jgi:predicted amidohydrolase
VDGWRFGCVLCIEVRFPESFQRYTALGVDCILFSAYADDAMFGIHAHGHTASHSYWVSVSVPTQMSYGLSSRLVALTGEVQTMATPSASGVIDDLVDEQCPRMEGALQRAKPWRVKARDGAIYRHR